MLPPRPPTPSSCLLLKTSGEKPYESPDARGVSYLGKMVLCHDIMVSGKSGVSRGAVDLR